MVEAVDRERERRLALAQRLQKVAESASRVKSDFLAMVSHELRTPMNGILGMSELALDTKLSNEQREYMEAIRGSAEGLTRVIDDLIDYSAMDAGRLTLQTNEFRLRERLAAIMRPMEERARAKGLEFSWRVDPDASDLLAGDAVRLGQVLTNLTDNAIKFTDRGSIEVMVRPESGAGAMQTLVFSVADTGEGIARDKQDALFEPFTQGEVYLTRRHGGAGLGLAIAKQLVTRMGGRVWLDGQPGAGTTVRFTVPLEVAQGRNGHRLDVEQIPKLAA
jgi:signal transduction histidine kinase